MTCPGEKRRGLFEVAAVYLKRLRGRDPSTRSCEGSGCLLAAAAAAGGRQAAGGGVGGRARAHARGGGVAARSPRRPGINGSISGRGGGALAAATASGSHYHRRQRLHHRRLDPSPPRRLLRPHPVPCSRSPRGPGPGNPRLPVSAEKLIGRPGRPGFKSRPCHLLTARSYPPSEPFSCEAAGETSCTRGFADPAGTLKAAPSTRQYRGARIPAPQG